MKFATVLCRVNPNLDDFFVYAQTPLLWFVVDLLYKVKYTAMTSLT